MKTRVLAAFLGLILAAAADAAGLRITQLADHSPDLMVFVAPDAASAPQPVSKEGAKAALGNATLAIKEAKPWNRQDGAAMVLAVDVSASMKAIDFPAVQRAVSGALAELPTASKAALLTIGTDAATKVDFGPVDAVRQALEGLSPDAPETALNEGLLAAQSLAARGRRDLPLRRFVLLVTDGLDDSKRAVGSKEMMDGVASADIPIFVVAVTAGRQRSAGLESLGQVARASGGGFVQSTSSRVAEDLKALVSEAFRADLLIVDCTPCTRDGTERKVQISLNRTGAEISGTRSTWLFAAPPPPSPQASNPPPPPSVTDWRVTLKIIWPWPLWQLATLLALLLVGGIAGAVVWQRRTASESKTGSRVSGILVHRQQWRVSGTPPPEPASPTVSLTLDVFEVGRMHITVGSDEVVLGRSASADVSTENDSEASSRHAALYVEKGVLTVRDLGSANGTALNGVRIVRPEPVHDRDVIRIGRTDIRVYFGRL